MDAVQKLPIGIQDFEKLRKQGFLYVDKTRLVYNLVNGGSYYFLSRPRRFGKSLLISTIKAYFQGKEDLFEGLAIEQLEKDWTEHPVLHLDLNTEKYDSAEVLESRLNLFLSNAEALYGVNPNEKMLGQRFEGVIRRAYEKTGQRVVILVDEYDKPLLQAIGNDELQEQYRGILKGFYGALKSMDGCIKFAMLTGVTKFGKVSVFSDLNHLNDISMSLPYYDICGVTEEELLSCFQPSIEALSEYQRHTFEESVAELRKKYDGYHFHPKGKGMYNPFSLLNALNKYELRSYWFETGTPTYLVDLLQMHDYNLEKMSRVETDDETLNSVDANSTNPIPVIYQSGYLTIKDFDPEFNVYTLGFPNKEVEEGFTKFLLPCYTSRRKDQTAFDVKNFVLDVRNGNTEQFLKRLRSLFADTPYELVKNLENHYQNVIWLLFKLLGFYVQAEYHTSEGRIDLVLQSPQFCYVMEFKLDGTAEEALAQIEDKHYTLPFDTTGRQIIRIGMNFDSNTRNIEKWIVG
ncbi:MAG: ATP-binding protein [Bacteroidaceae bacterium]|nr:ATP-binding protein [Bacteroidaceae bacterium]